MGKLFTVDILQVRKSPYEIGVEIGTKIRNRTIVKTLRGITRPAIDLEGMEKIFQSYAPHLLEELEGLSEGLGIHSAEAAALLSGYDIPRLPAMGCSTFMTAESYVRNYDFSPALYDGLYTLIQGEEFFSSAGYNLQILGRHDGVNEHGLAAGFHFVSHKDYQKGISAWTAVRMILDVCVDTEDAIHLLKELPHATCYNFSVSDGKGNIAVIEASPQTAAVRRGEEVLACVNHYQNPEMKQYNRDFIENSINRNEFLNTLAREKKKEINHHFHLFKNPASPMFFTDYENLFGTLHTIAYYRKDSRILTSLAKGTSYLDFRFRDWLDGKDLPQNELVGFISAGEEDVVNEL